MTVLAFPSRDDDEPRDSKSVARGWVERQSTGVIPAPGRAAASARWWCTEGLARLSILGLRLPVLLLAEIRPTLRGFGRVCVAWSHFVGITYYADTIQVAETGDKKMEHAKNLKRGRAARGWLSFVFLCALVGVTWWAVIVYPLYAAAAGILLCAILDFIGRAGTEKVTKLPPPARVILREGVPMQQITKAMIEVFEREGLEVGIEVPVRYDTPRMQYITEVTCLDDIETRHLRALERGLGADDYAARSVKTGIATIRRIIIQDGDPLAHVDHPPWVDTGSVSINDRLDLGVSVTETPFAVRFAGVHCAVVGQNGSGKSKGLLWAAIDRISACRDAVLVGIDLAGGPALPMWGKVIRRAAYTPEDAEVLLNWCIREMDRRMAVLKAIAEDEDPDNDADEWHSGLGPALVIVIDEFAMLVEHNGEKGRFDLLGKVMTLHRVGRKVWISFLEGTQKTGNSDFGSKVIDTQVKVRIMMACAERDTVTMLGTEARDGGWSPHLLSPATEHESRDAGKCYISGPEHRDPDIYRTYRPMRGSDVKRRAARRVADGIPTLDDLGSPVGLPAEVEGAIVPPMLAAAEKAFADAGNPGWMATKDLLAALTGEFPGLNENRLSLGIGVARDGARRRQPDGTQLRGYTLAAVRSALEEL